MAGQAEEEEEEVEFMSCFLLEGLDLGLAAETLCFSRTSGLETCLYARWELFKFDARYGSASQAGEAGRRSPSTSKLLQSLSDGTVFLRPGLKSLRDSRLK